jgi:hypothetical protein
MHTHHSNAFLESALRSVSLDEALAITRTLPDRENATAPIEPARALALILFAGGNAVMNRVRGHGVPCVGADEAEGTGVLGGEEVEDGGVGDVEGGDGEQPV